MSVSKKINLFLTATAVVLSCVLIFSFCSKSNSVSENDKDKVIKKIDSSFESKANIKYKDIQAQVVIINEPSKSCTVKFLSPKGIDGMSFTYDGTDIAIDYKGMSFSFNPDTIPGSAVANMIVSTINSATSKEGVTVVLNKNVLEITGDSEAGEFILRLDKDNGNFIKLSIPESEFEMEFVNFNFL